MLDLEFFFSAGRYHSTPWGRNVNEGVPEWPPSPYRLARALIDVWKRKLPDLPEERFLKVLESISGAPSFSLPPWSEGHIRVWLSSNTRVPTARQLVFDPFVAVGRDTPVRMRFNTCPTEETRSDLSALLERLAYFGRSESWVEAGVMINDQSADIQWNCLPDEDAPPDRSAPVFCLSKPEDGETSGWLSSLCMTTETLLSEGRSSPPFLLRERYGLPMARNLNHAHAQVRVPGKEVRCALYALSSTVLPKVEETLSFAERVRAYLMGIHKKIAGGAPDCVSVRFSGKDREGKPLQGHRHAFFQPMDIDGDGRIDHLYIHCAEPFADSEIRALDRLRTVWQPKGRPEVRFILVSLSGQQSSPASRCWESATPFVTARHFRKGRGSYGEWIEGELLREIDAHGLPRPSSISPLAESKGRTARTPWWAFRRSRKDTLPLKGHGFRLEFETPVQGYFALGSLCHFGLGFFVPRPEDGE